MAKGVIAKQTVEDKIREVFGKDFLGVADKKIYVQAEEDGQMVQVAITMTCPKTPFAAGGITAEDGFPEGNFSAPTEYKPAEITNEELDNVRRMIKELGL